MKKSILIGLGLLTVCLSAFSACTNSENVPAPTSAPTSTSTPSATSTPTSTPTFTPTPTDTPTPTNTPTPTATPTPTYTPTPSPTPVLIGNDTVGYITTERTIRDTEFIQYVIGPDVYILPNLEKKTDDVFRTVEYITGLSTNNDNRREKYQIAVVRGHDVYENRSGYYPEGVMGILAPSDIFIAPSRALTESFSRLMFGSCIPNGYYSILGRGFSEYTTLRVIEALSATDPNLAQSIGTVSNLYLNAEVDYLHLSQQPFEFWLTEDATDGISEYFDPNELKGIGLRFMTYLDSKYGKYTSWLLNLNATYSDKKAAAIKNADASLSEDSLNTLIMIEALKETYGDDVFDGFYPWLCENDTLFSYKAYPSYPDLKAVNEATVYPTYNILGNNTAFSFSGELNYKDLTVDLDPCIFYLKEYKKEDVSNLTLEISPDTIVETYDKDGKLLDTFNNAASVSLKNASSFKLSGEGFCTLKITGYTKYGDDHIDTSVKPNEKSYFSQTVTLDITEATTVGDEKTGYFSSHPLKIETEYFDLFLDPHVYIVPNVIEKSDKLLKAVEHVTGRSLKDAKYYDKKFTVHVNRANKTNYLIENQGDAMASENYIWITPSDLFVNDSDTFVHELSHAFHREFVGTFAGTVLDEGISTYTSYKTIKYLMKTDPDLGIKLGSAEHAAYNYSLDNSELYSRSLEYWMHNESEASQLWGNGDYCVGYRLMHYLDDVYGDYTAWFEAYEELALEKVNSTKEYSRINTLPRDQLIDIGISSLKKTYGNDVLDNFYPWLKKNQHRFIPDTSWHNDLTDVREYAIYPFYYWGSNETEIGLQPLTDYTNVIINLEPLRFYLKEYKGEDISNLTLHLSQGTKAVLYDSNGERIRGAIETEIPLTDVYSIELIGPDTTIFNITGYNIYNNRY